MDDSSHNADRATRSSNIDRQFGFVNNLFIGLASGLLAFLFQISLSLRPHSASMPERLQCSLAVILLFLSLAAGGWLAWRRINHFRMLARHESLDAEDKRGNFDNILVSEKGNRKLLKLEAAFFLAALLAVSTLAVEHFMFQ